MAYDTKAPVSKDSTDSLLREIRESYDYDYAEWKPIHDEGRTDMLCVAGDVWEAMDPEGKKQRDKAHRPMITADELNQYFNQVINGIRANQRAVKFSPVGDGANDDGAQFYADKMREIEYRSKAAAIVYPTAFSNAVQRGYGFCRVKTKYSTIKGQRQTQDIWIEAIPNPDQVLPDADALMPDGSDMKRCFVLESWPVEQFRREFGERARIKHFTSDHMTMAPAWVKPQHIMVGEYWKVKVDEAPWLLVERPGLVDPLMGPQPPTLVDEFRDEYQAQPGDRVLEEGTRERRSVCMYPTNGVEVLATHEWPGRYIPIVSCYGKVVYVNHGAGSKRILLSMTRLAREPYLLYCYYRTTQAEIVGMTPKTPYWWYEGQLDEMQMQAVAKSLHEPVAGLTAKAFTEATGGSGNLLPLPQRQPYSPEIERMEIGAEGARRAIQSAMATNFMPTQAQRRNDKSGKALEKIDEVSQKGSYHFNDAYDSMISQIGVIIEDLIPHIYDTDREVGIRKANDTAEIVRINGEGGVSTKGEYQVTVSTGPAFDSTREAESEFADTLMETPFAPRIADLVVKLKGSGPVLDEIAERLTPPEFKKPKEGGGPDPMQLMQMMQQMQAENQDLKQILSQLAFEIKAKKLEIESRERIAHAQIASQEKIALSKDTTAVVTTGMKLENASDIAQMEAELQRVQSVLDGQEAEMARYQESVMGRQAHAQQQEARQQEHQQARELTDRQHLQSADLAEQGQMHALEQLAAQPQPETEA